VVNLDLNDPSVDPLELLGQFKRWTEQDQAGLYKSGFTDFGVFLWVYENWGSKEESIALVTSYEKMDILKEQIFELLATWINSDLLIVGKKEQVTIFIFKG
jgi:hypothetical protein